MKKIKQQNKHNHHINPRLYLSGFTETPKSPMLWVYEHGYEYCPGIRFGANPRKLSVRNASVVRDYYACRFPDGTIEYNKYENELEKLEKPADSIFKKLRDYRLLTLEEKMRLSRYIVMMYKRVPQRLVEAGLIWPKIVEDESMFWVDAFAKARRDAAGVGDFARVRRLESVQEEVEKTMARYKDVMPDQIRLESMIAEMPRVQSAMVAMGWQYFIAPIGDFFVTSDNPFFRDSELGLNKPNSEFVFPISSQIAIVASWICGDTDSFVYVDSHKVREVNRKIINSASKWVFAKENAKRIYDLVQSV